MEGDVVFDRFTGRKDGTLWYYGTLVNVFRKVGSNALIDELDRVVAELEHLPSKCAQRSPRVTKRHACPV